MFYKNKHYKIEVTFSSAVKHNFNNMEEETNCERSAEDGANKIINNIVENRTISALSAIAIEYEFSDDEEFKENVSEITSNNVEEKKDNDKSEVTDYDRKAYRTNEGNEESDSESTSDSDSSVLSTSTDTDSNNADSDSDSIENNEIERRKKNIQEKQPRKKELKNELDDLPPIEDLTISVPEVLCDPLGEVAWMVEQLVIVCPKPGKPTLNLDTVLFVDKGQKALGKVFDVFGQVNDPHYCVRFNSYEHIQEKEIKVGMLVYYCPNSEYTSLVFAHELLKMKGSDTVDDGEAPDFSDDEEERKYYENLEKNKQNKEASSSENVPQKRRRTSISNSSWQSNHPWNRNVKSQNHKGVKSHTSVRNPYHPRYNNTWYHSFNNGKTHPKNLRPNDSNMASNHSNNYYYGPQHNYYNGNGFQTLNPRTPFGMPPTFYPPFPHSSFQPRMFRPPYGDVHSQAESSSSNWLMHQLPPPPPPPPSSVTQEPSISAAPP